MSEKCEFSATFRAAGASCMNVRTWRLKTYTPLRRPGRSGFRPVVCIVFAGLLPAYCRLIRLITGLLPAYYRLNTGSIPACAAAVRRPTSVGGGARMPDKSDKRSVELLTRLRFSAGRCTAACRRMRGPAAVRPGGQARHMLTPDGCPLHGWASRLRQGYGALSASPARGGQAWHALASRAARGPQSPQSSSTPTGWSAASGAGRVQVLSSSTCRPSREASWQACMMSST